jgi:radical SAM-linked protein
MTQHDTTPTTARVEYAKRGRLRFIGHLDTMRMIVRAVRAAGLPACTTHGCSPHLDVSFGPALPVGQTADSEFFDLRLAEPADPAAMRDALAARVPEGLEVRSVRLIAGKAESLGTYLDRADYTVHVPAGVPIAREAVERFLSSDEVVVVRARGGPRGRHEREKRVNVRRYVERLEVFEAPDGGTRLEMTVAVTPQGSANPVEVLEALTGQAGPARSGVRVHRTRTYHAADGG